jgi:hypothetical protein
MEVGKGKTKAVRWAGTILSVSVKDIDVPKLRTNPLERQFISSALRSVVLTFTHTMGVHRYETPSSIRPLKFKHRRSGR